MRTTISLLCLCALGALASAASTPGPRFYPDDPIAREPETQDASHATAYSTPEMYDLMKNLFVTSGQIPSGLRAQNLNTIDEVPDSSWFTNRVGTRSIPMDDLVRGANTGTPPDPSKWTLTREKSAGVQPGFTAIDGRGETWFLQFDSPRNPEAATAAIAIASKIFWALGYNQVESFITTFDPSKASIDAKATMKRPDGGRSPLTRDDMHAILERAARNADGTYRVIAGRLLPGKILGGFQYAGTRPDDPNDLVPHEHRRELRALRVFGAWTNLTDLKVGNTLDTLITENGKSIVKHYLQDVGSTFGMCNDEHEWDLSWEYFYDGGKTMKRLVTLGFGLSPWQTVDYVEYPSVGKFEGEVFDPTKWRPHTPTPAYMELRADDAFWAAQRVAAFSEEMIRAIVHTGQFSDAAAEKHLADVLIQRRDKIAQAYLNQVNPVVDPQLGAKGLTFENIALVVGAAHGPVVYRAAWMSFDNATGATAHLGNTSSDGTTLAAPLPRNGFVAVDITAHAEAYPAWARPLRAYFRRDTQRWMLVGLERLPAALH
jgi:hypothetical protein